MRDGSRAGSDIVVLQEEEEWLARTWAIQPYSVASTCILSVQYSKVLSNVQISIPGSKQILGFILFSALSGVSRLAFAEMPSLCISAITNFHRFASQKT
jgi:hypothetical protein